MIPSYILLPISPSLALATEFINRKTSWEQSMLINADMSNLILTINRYIPKPTQRYVPDGVSLVCTDGTKPAKLVVTNQTKVFIAGGKLMGTVKDRMDCNLNCVKMVIAGAIIGAIVAAVVVAVVAAAGVFTGGGAWVAIGVGLAAGAGGAVAGAGVGQLTSMIPCICACLTNAPWIPTHPFAKAEDLQTLVESSRLKCFLGGEIMIFYSPEAAQARADINSTQMWLDLGLTVIGGALLGAAGVGIGSFIYGAGVACSAGASGAGGFLGGLKAGSAYVLGGLANMAGGFFGGQVISFIKDNVIYKNVSIGEDDNLYEYKDGTIIDEAINDNELQSYFPSSPNNSDASDFKSQQENATGITGNDLGSGGGVYSGSNSSDYIGGGGLWDSDQFVSTATNPTIRGYRGYLGSQFGSGFLDSFKLGGKQNSVNRAFFLADIAIDGYNMLRSSILEGDINKFADSLEFEEAAKAAIKVLEDNI